MATKSVSPQVGRSFMNMPLIIDSHQDLAWNMLRYGRDYTCSVQETRRLEASTKYQMCGAIGTIDCHFHLLGVYQVFAFQRSWQDISPLLSRWLLINPQ